ncbi:MAG TPA: NAD(+)/NADH kinase [Dehalococcoidales bacterium]|nr:NAD(+)/NADH kinase [Dehalococcoidales bacterium]
MKRIGIIYHPLKEPAVKLAAELKTFLRRKGLTAWSGSAWDVEATRCHVEGTDLVVSIGGDGTILRAAQCILPAQIPITGINLGMLGFMTELTVAEAKKQLARLLEGEGWIDERAVIEAELRQPKVKKKVMYYALNDVIVARGDVVRVILVEAKIDGKPLTIYKADGVIVSTATGSTGYALAAGGPVLHPQSQDMLLLPILPHLSSNFRLVVAPDSAIELKVLTMHSAALSVDGHINPPLTSGSVITVRRSRHTVRFLRIHPRDSFYLNLAGRLKGKQ